MPLESREKLAKKKKTKKLFTNFWTTTVTRTQQLLSLSLSTTQCAQSFQKKANLKAKQPQKKKVKKV
jgi:hypothetical protein